MPKESKILYSTDTFTASKIVLSQHYQVKTRNLSRNHLHLRPSLVACICPETGNSALFALRHDMLGQGTGLKDPKGACRQYKRSL